MRTLLVVTAFAVLSCRRTDMIPDAGTPMVEDAGPIDAGSTPDAGPRADDDFFVTDGRLVGPLTDADLKLEVFRDFTCRPESVGAELTVASIGGTPERFVIRPGAGACLFDLLSVGPAGEVRLSDRSAGYLFVVATSSGTQRAACASNIESVPKSGRVRTIERVGIECFLLQGAARLAVVDAVPADATFAAWVRSVEPHPSRPNTLVLTWLRDFSFQLFNQNDDGRPATDGIFTTELTIDSAALRVGTTTRLSSQTNDLATAPTTLWEPSPSDLADFARARALLDAGP